QLTSTRYVVTLNNRPNRDLRVLEPMPPLDRRYFRLDHEVPDLNVRIYEIPEPLPRAYFRGHWQPVASPLDALKEIFWAERSGFDPANTVLVDREKGAVDVPEPPKSEAPVLETAKEVATAAILSDRAERVEVTVDNAAPGFLVLADTYYPGWKAYENARSLVVYQANGFQKAVWLEPGRHRVSFTYKPYSLFWGGVLSLASLAILLMLVLAEHLSRSGRATNVWSSNLRR